MSTPWCYISDFPLGSVSGPFCCHVRIFLKQKRLRVGMPFLIKGYQKRNFGLVIIWCARVSACARAPSEAGTRSTLVCSGRPTAPTILRDRTPYVWPSRSHQSRNSEPRQSKEGSNLQSVTHAQRTLGVELSRKVTPRSSRYTRH